MVRKVSRKSNVVIVNKQPASKQVIVRKKGTIRKHIPIGFPATTTCKLVYSDYFSVNVTATPTIYSIRANGLYDPNQTSTGHQPMFFDTYASIYDHYVVTAADIKATFYPEEITNGTSQFGTVVGIKLDDDNSISPVTSMVHLIEQPNKLFHWKLMRSGALYDKNITSVKHNYNPVSFFGIKDIKDNQDTLGAATTTNPVEEAYFNIVVGTPTDGVDLPAIPVLIKVTYTVQFSELKDMGSS